MDETEYPDVRVSMETEFDGVTTPLKIRVIEISKKHFTFWVVHGTISTGGRKRYKYYNLSIKSFKIFIKQFEYQFFIYQNINYSNIIIILFNNYQLNPNK